MLVTAGEVIGYTSSRAGIRGLTPYATEAEVAHAGVDRLGTARRRAVAQAVGVGARVGTSLDHLPAVTEVRLMGTMAPHVRCRRDRPSRDWKRWPANQQADTRKAALVQAVQTRAPADWLG